jgi:hypothetical protein
MSEKWIEAINEDIVELRKLVSETRRLADAAEIQAKASEKKADEVVLRTDYLFALMYASQNRPWWKKFLGIDAFVPSPR